ncbi:GNAT family N-acetyltransferase [Paenibacillus marinisediminis]
MEQWSDHIEVYELSDEYSLHHANSEEWGIYYSVYYNMEYNGFFKDQGLTMNHWRKKFWIYRGPNKIGGVVIAPNLIFGLFFIPPFNEQSQVMKLLKNTLLHWSDRTKNITAFEILPDQIELFSRAGFWPGEYRCRWMQRPTETFHMTWEEQFRIASPDFSYEGDRKRLVNEEEMAEFFYRGFSNKIDQIRRKWDSLDSFTAMIRDYPAESNEQLLSASTLVYDSESNQLIGACLVSMQDNLPAIYDISVLPSYSGKGIATRMLKRALSVLKELNYPILRLYVMQGNHAESVYYNLGFIPGPLEVQHCYIPASTVDVTSHP